MIHGLIWTNNRAADYAWDLIESGEMRCLSIRARSIRTTVVDGISFSNRWNLREVSICRNGGNPDCTFEIFTPSYKKMEDA